MKSKAKGNHPKNKEVTKAKLNVEITGDINNVQLQKIGFKSLFYW